MDIHLLKITSPMGPFTKNKISKITATNALRISSCSDIIQRFIKERKLWSPRLHEGIVTTQLTIPWRVRYMWVAFSHHKLPWQWSTGGQKSKSNLEEIERAWSEWKQSMVDVAAQATGISDCSRNSATMNTMRRSLYFVLHIFDFNLSQVSVEFLALEAKLSSHNYTCSNSALNLVQYKYDTWKLRKASQSNCILRFQTDSTLCV